jgi:hypothetical protein
MKIALATPKNGLSILQLPSKYFFLPYLENLIQVPKLVTPL